MSATMAPRDRDRFAPSKRLSVIGRGILRTQTDVPSVAGLLIHFDGHVERARVVECFDKRVLAEHERLAALESVVCFSV
jgi:hypothetical protein